MLRPIGFDYYGWGGISIFDGNWGNDLPALPDIFSYSPYSFGFSDFTIGRNFYGSIFCPDWFGGFGREPSYEIFSIGARLLTWGDAANGAYFNPMNPWSWLLPWKTELPPVPPNLMFPSNPAGLA